MATVDLKLSLPEKFHQEAEKAGLLTPKAIEQLLREELAKLAEVRLVSPDNSDKAIREGQRMAAEIRAQLAQSDKSTTLDETMQQLRGCSWSS